MSFCTVYCLRKALVKNNVLSRSRRLVATSKMSATISASSRAQMLLHRVPQMLPQSTIIHSNPSDFLSCSSNERLMNAERIRNFEEFANRSIGQSKRLFSTTTKPFSRKKPVKKPTEAEDEATNSAIDASEPLPSFNYQATLGIIQIARAIAPIVSMNEGYILTANYDLRTDGKQRFY